MYNKTSGHVVGAYDQELVELLQTIVHMTRLVGDMLRISTKSLFASELEAGELVQVIDKQINSLDLAIEQKATNILALRQPMAIDLRQVLASLKLAVILERMGDLAKKISERQYTPFEAPEDAIMLLQRMSSTTLEMIESAASAVDTLDSHKLEIIKELDEQVDVTHNALVNRFTKEIIKSPANTSVILNFIFTIKNLERIGDYAVKIAALVDYINNGPSQHKKI